jgi:flagellar basal body-associated protein FliL
MADKPAEKKPETPPAAEKKEAPAKKGGGLLTQTPVLLGGVMLVEAVVLFGGFKFLMGSQPKTAAGADLVSPTTNPSEGSADAAADPNKLVEVQLVDFKALNKLSGHSFLYDISIFVTTKSQNEQMVTDSIKNQDALIEDRIRTIIAELDPEKLGGGSEPGLETLRRQVKFQLDQILGDGLVEEVLVPRCIPFRTDY